MKCGSDRLTSLATFLYIESSQVLIVLYKTAHEFRAFKTSKSSALENTYGAAAFI